MYVWPAAYTRYALALYIVHACMYVPRSLERALHATRTMFTLFVLSNTYMYSMLHACHTHTNVKLAVICIVHVALLATINSVTCNHPLPPCVFQLVLTSIPMGRLTFFIIWMKSMALPESLLVTTTIQFLRGIYKSVAYTQMSELYCQS